MTARPRRTTTLVGPNRLVVAAATAGLVALASAGTALLVLTGTSSVAPQAAPAPPLPSSAPFTHSPGVVVVPSHQPAPQAAVREQEPRHADVPVALAFTDVPAVDVPAVAAPTVVPPVVPPVASPPALRRTPTPEITDTRPGRHLAKEHLKHKHPKLHGERVGWSHSEHYGNR